MTDEGTHRPVDLRSETFVRRLRRRRAAAKRLRLYGVAAIAVALGMLAILLSSIVMQGYPAFIQTQIRLEIFFDPEVVAPSGSRDPHELARGNYGALIREALTARLPGVESREERRALTDLASPSAAYRLSRMVAKNPQLLGSRQTMWLPASDDVDQLVKGVIPRDIPQSQRRVSDRQLTWIDELAAAGTLEQRFNTDFFTQAKSRDPEVAGVLGAVVGSCLTMALTLALAFPVAVAAAVYLEEFAPKNVWTDVLEVIINNLVAVPSIIFGLLGLVILLNFLNLPRSTPLVGGMVLALMILPVIIIASREALKAVPPSVREAALAVGASHLQVVWYHVLPLALPGILTGTILSMAQALGETAPLLLVGKEGSARINDCGLLARFDVVDGQHLRKRCDLRRPHSRRYAKNSLRSGTVLD